jgi:two-component system response regulator AtoC
MAADLKQCFRVDPKDLPGEAVIFGGTAAMREVHSKIERVVASDLPVVLHGETGTGKDLVARFLHARSRRSNGPFVKLSCAAIPRHLLERELMGCEQGSGTDEGRPGLVELAAEGTLFLEEVGEMDLTLQRKLLLLLEDGRYSRVGSCEERLASVRIVCATNVNLAVAVRRGTFRQDLFNHLEAMCLRLSALRERKEDIPQLWDFFTDKLARRFSRSAPQLTPGVLRVLEQWDWPGNLCELENCIARAVILGDEERIGDELRRQAETTWRSRRSSRQITGESQILQALKARHWNQRKTMKELKRNYRSLLYRLGSSGVLQRQRRRTRFPRPE